MSYSQWTPERIRSAFASLNLRPLSDLTDAQSSTRVEYECLVCGHRGHKTPYRAEKGDQCLVCARRERSRSASHGTVTRYGYGCRCGDCRRAKADYTADLRARKRSAAAEVSGRRLGMDCLVCGDPLVGHSVLAPCVLSPTGTTWRIR